MAFQSIQPCFPEGANPFHPGYGLAERLAVQTADVVAAVYVALDEAGPLEHHQVFRNGVERNRKLLGDIGDPGRSRTQLFENRPAGGIGNRRSRNRLEWNEDGCNGVWSVFFEAQGWSLTLLDGNNLEPYATG